MSRLSQRCALLTALVALSASQTTLAQTCADLIFAEEVTSVLPEAQAACLDVVPTTHKNQGD